MAQIDSLAARLAPPADGAVWKSRLQAAGRFLEPAAGSWIDREVLFGVTWLQILLAAVTLAVTLVVEQTLRASLRRRLRRHAREGGRRSWAGLAFEAAVPPLALFLWIWAFYAAFSILLIGVMTEPSLVTGTLTWLNRAGVIAALFWFLFRLIHRFESRLRENAAATPNAWDDVVTAVACRALRLILPLIAAILIVPTLEIPQRFREFFGQGVSLLLIFAVGYILYEMVAAVEEGLLSHVELEGKDTLRARKIYTQVKMLKKVAVVVIGVFTTASMLMVFEPVRRLGTSILASAGIAGIILGLAAQRSLGALLAGLQIAVTQPIRLDDSVVVEGEFGTIEEITLTYVVVRLWDLRRMVVPINYFIEKPFQSWTRTAPDLIGSVYLYVDYTAPVDELRQEFERILEASPLWDRKVKALQVTDSKERTLEIRALVSAADAGKAWDLRCQVREKLVDFLQRNHPECLPKQRAELFGWNSTTDPQR